MRISEKKKTELYAAIYDPIMDSRIKVLRNDASLRPRDADDLLHKLTNEIWDSVKAKLEIDD